MPLRARRQGERGSQRRLVAVPGPFRPAMTARRVYTRWGTDASGECLRAVAALDARTGEVVWSTDEDPAWETMQPISDPAAADGRVYVLAIQEQVGPILPIHLVCLDAEQGTLLWERTLGSQNPALDFGEGYAFRRGEGIEQVRYGNAVTVRRGAVYCSTNLGFVARCDARDGLVEWVAPYRRVGMGQEWLGVLRRQGAAPVVCGDRVIVMPRDYQGVFAVDRRTGRRLWNAPLVPAEEPVGLAADLCLVKSTDSLFALEVGSGRVAWHRRLSGPILGRTALAGGVLVVGTQGGLLALRAETGETLEERGWDETEPPVGFVLRGRTLASVSRVSAGLAPAASVPDAPDTAPLAVPVKRIWHLPRTEPRLWVPPPEANVPGRLYLASRGVLECVRMAVRKEPLWQRFAEPDLVDVAWAGGTLILVCDRRLVALDAATGVLRWDGRLPLQTSQHKVVGSELAVTGYADERQREPMAALVDLASGRLLWSQRLPEQMSSFRRMGIARRGDRIHLVSEGRRRGKNVHATLDVADGKTVDVVDLPADDREQVRISALGEEVGFYLTEGGALYEFPLTDPASARLRADLENFTSRAGVRMDLSGPWLRIIQFEGGQYRTQRQWVFRIGDPSYRLHLERYGEVRGNVTYTHEGATLTVTDLQTRKDVTYVVPGAYEPEAFGGIFDFHRTGEGMWVASLRAAGGRDRPATLQLDTFDAATGAHRRTQTVPGIFPQPYRYGREEENERRGTDGNGGSEIVWTPEAIFVTDSRGLHALATAPKGECDWGHRVLVARAAGEVAIDGDLGEWDDAGAVPLEGEGGRRGRLVLAHDADNLYLAVRCADPSFVPCVGRGDASGGDWLEIGLAAGTGSHRWGLGADARGRAGWRTLTQQPLPEGLQGAVRHDPVGGQLVYEAAIPREGLSEQAWDTRRMGLSIAVWDEQPGGGPARVLTWGAGVAGRDLLADGHQAIYIDPLTEDARRAMRSVVDELPDLPEAFEYVNESLGLRATSAQGLLALMSDSLKRYPQSMTVGRLLAFDHALRVRGMADPRVDLLDGAAAAGVPEPIRRRYASLSQAYLSQWVYVPDAHQYPRSIALDLFDGITRPRGWGHRVFWVKTGWYGEVPAVHMPERFPNARWHEIRVPLVMLGMADSPVCGIRYLQQGEPALVWDRTAVVAGGKEQVFLDDALPAGAVADGGWRWVDDPVKSGTKAHSATPPGERYKTASHGVQDFRQPILHHLMTPGGPYLSQWVYLDPKDLPRAVSLGLHDGRQWCFNAIWGEMSGRGRYMGPLPAPGGWQELRLPLAWTPLAARPISGLYFAHVGGRVVWDRTALVAGGKTHVVLDDDASVARSGKVKRTWAPWAGDHVGGATLAPGKVGVALELDGLTGQVEVPHSPALEPAEMTLEAWIFLDRWPQSGDIRRWIVNKNTHEQTDGHYALVISGMQVGAYLNIGGKEGTFQAWSGSGVLTLREWHHVAMTFDERDLKVYHNGRLAGATPVNQKRRPGLTPLLIGGRQDGYCHFGGRIDEIRLWGRALSDRDVLARYESGGAAPAKPDTAPAGHWGFDNQASPADLAEGWQWVDGPVKSGKRAHTQAPADGYAGHACLLKEPILAHLPYDPKHVLAVLRRSVPALGLTGEAWRMVQRMLTLSAGPAERAEICKWFLAKMPGHPHAGDALAALLDAYEASGTADPVAAVEADLKGLSLPRETVYVFHRRHTHPGRHFVRSWQVVGPFTNPQGQGHSIAYPPESEGLDLGAAYDGASGRVRWKPHTSPWEFVSLYAALAQGEPATGSADPQPLDYSTAYAVCWVHSAAARQAVLQVGYNDTAKVWINGQLVLDGTTYAMQSRPEDGVPVDLPTGWSEVLLKTSNQQRTWEFYLELMDPLGRGPPQGVTFSTTPPANAP
ncbi:MAG TPA: PQQ-binding-like beta-propeller repeat protein [Phycisphaerae bacterium]|nr:PQQ-binding-like beta-propeller repeat protein [Phycisphaerae bacterium]